jgi:hypothetical protein
MKVVAVESDDGVVAEPIRLDEVGMLGLKRGVGHARAALLSLARFKAVFTAGEVLGRQNRISQLRYGHSNMWKGTLLVPGGEAILWP